LVFAREKFDNESFEGYMVPNKMIMNFDVFSSSMKDWIRGQVGGTNIVIK